MEFGDENMHCEDYIIDNDGNFRFTKTGLLEQAPLLAKAGIDPQSIKTYKDYNQARELARPYFMAYLSEETEKRFADNPDSLGSRMMRAIVLGDDDELKKVDDLMERRARLKVVV